jgi:hypothetical protein
MNVAQRIVLILVMFVFVFLAIEQVTTGDDSQTTSNILKFSLTVLGAVISFWLATGKRKPKSN